MILEKPMASRKKKQQHLVRLSYLEDGSFYPSGDTEDRIVQARAIDIPFVITDIPIGTWYSKQLRYFEERAPPNANAFVLGEIVPGEPSDTHYDQCIQYYAIDPKVWERARRIKQRPSRFTGWV